MQSRLAPFALSAFVALPSAAAAQAWSYPAFQAPITETREFNFGVADAGRAGTSLVAQWREAAGTRSQFTLETGLVSPEGEGNTLLILGGQYAYQLARSTADVPIDFLLTAGAGLTLGDPVVLRVPAGLVAGHRFELDGNMFLTPYVHPRLSFDLCTDCADETALAIDFDLGVNFEVTRTIAIRGAAFFGGGDLFPKNGIGISLAWRPPGLTR